MTDEPDTKQTPDTGAQDTSSEPINADNKLDLAMWGIAEAGKTVLMVQLYLATRSRQQGPWSIFPDKEAEPYMDKLRNILERERRFPPPTLRESAVPIVYHFQHRQDGRRAQLKLVDRAGALWEEFKNDPELIGQLAKAHGLALLVDPFKDPQINLHRIEDTLLALVHARENIVGDPRPIAICLTKADAWIRDWKELVQARDDPDAYARERLDILHPHSSILQLLLDHCSNIRFFPVSSVGTHAAFGYMKPAAYLDDKLQGRILPGGQPLNIIEPFLWLIEQAGVKNE
uniref:Double-GTPase 2 domain-containing protein n=1 Tax=Candidatus Kentrum sp. LPFa TaxID=2126335 RepID=A0A450VZJ6_9GAMM|nr:MAG: hypothetical protein BECKLPF1236B_GA0070989_10139 [Candidatus Kentron sp. LPFa]